MTDLTQHWRRAYENKFLGSWDLYDSKRGVYTEVRARITDARYEDVIGEGGRRTRPLLLYLAGKKGPIAVPMIVSKTSGKTLEVMFGEAPASWVGKEITLYVNKSKRVAKGTGAVLTIRNERAGRELKDELRQREAPAIDPEDFESAPEPQREPGEEG